MRDFTPLGLAIGHATDHEGATGVTVVRGIAEPLRCGTAVIGRATGTRDVGVGSPFHLVERVDAVMLTGGSAYGLDAAAGVMRWMEERGRGFPIGPGVVPIVPAAVIFDLAPCGRFDRRPTPEMAYGACEVASPIVTAEGSIGAGTGATVGKALGPAHAMKGGFGCEVRERGGVMVGACAVVNALGDVRDAAGRILAGARHPGVERTPGAPYAFADAAALIAEGRRRSPGEEEMRNTTIAVVATNALLSRVELAQLAQAASAALYRRITPTGTSFDGDMIFALGPMSGATAPVIQVEALAVEALEGAIERAVRLAVGRDGVPGLADESAVGGAWR